jgi:preprotein translocase subunit SecG
VLYIILNVLFIAVCIGLTVAILLQKKSSQGLGSIAGMGNSDRYWDKNKSRSYEGKLEKYTKIGGAIMFVFSLVICLVR